MAEVTTGVRSVLSLPWAYNLWSKFIGAAAARRNYVEQYLRPNEGDRILDIGCGTGKMFDALPDWISYTGFDLNQAYVEQAASKYGSAAAFVHGEVGAAPQLPTDAFDVAIATGILHHLDDDEAMQLFELALGCLKPGGRLVTSDPVYGEGQSSAARFIISLDRGQNVRTREEYVSIAESVFRRVDVDIRHDRIRIPYTHILMACTK